MPSFPETRGDIDDTRYYDLECRVGSKLNTEQTIDNKTNEEWVDVNFSDEGRVPQLSTDAKTFLCLLPTSLDNSIPGVRIFWTLDWLRSSPL